MSSIGSGAGARSLAGGGCAGGGGEPVIDRGNAVGDGAACDVGGGAACDVGDGAACDVGDGAAG
ncbi:MAG: hypothetical protein V3T05_07880, partial [Myxococcota bacterium]